MVAGAPAGGAAPGAPGPGALAVKAGAAAGAADGSTADGRTPKELEDKINKLKEKLERKRKSGMGRALANRAEAAMEGRQRKRSKKNDKGSSELSEDFEEAPPAGSNRRIQQLGKHEPGALLASGLEQIKAFLAQRGGAATDSELDELHACVVQYITSIWHGKHPVGEMGARNVQELRTMGEALDALLRGDLPHLGDLLMQRLKAIEQATKDGHWSVAKHLELVEGTDVGLATAAEVSAAAGTFSEQEKLRDRLAKAGKRVKPP